MYTDCTTADGGRQLRGGEILSLRRTLPFAWQRSKLLYNSFDVLELALLLYVVWYGSAMLVLC